MDEDTKVIRRGGKRTRKQREATPRRKFSFGRLILRLVWITLLIILVLGVIGGGVGLGFLAGIMRELPSLDTIGAPRPNRTSFVYSADGEVIAELHGPENRVPVALEEVPTEVQNAFIACEDHRFWDHRGADPIAIGRALWVDLQAREFKEGASTITQQVVKIAYTSPDKDLRRKVQDVILAIQMERRFTKEEIFEMYLNLVPFGHNACGIQAAAQTYFGKDASQLTLPEGALLAGMLKAQNYYSPYHNYDAAIGRQRLVIDLMAKHGFITEQEAEDYKKVELKLVGLDARDDNYQAPHFTDYVLSQLVARHGSEKVYEGGLQIYTTVNMKIQRAAEQAIRDALDEEFPLDSDEVQPQMAAIVIDPHTGHIVAMVGGRTHSSRLELNRAVQSFRQPGSSFKPIMSYAPAIDMGYTAASIIDDAPVQYRQYDGSVWVPNNYDFRYRGLTPFRDGLQWSINVMAVRLLERVGVKTAIEYAQKLGITSLVTEGAINDTNLAVALGGLTRGVSPLELTSAFGVFGTDGIRAAPFAVTRVVDPNGNVLERNEPQLEVVLRPGSGYILTQMLTTAVEAGTGTQARVPGHVIAGKTGTTTDNVDAWFVGYSPQYVCGVWMGHDQPKDMGSVWGGTYAAPVFAKIMTVAHEGIEPHPFPKPSGLIEGVAVCTKSGMLAGPLCPPERIRREVFVRGTQPTGVCTVHVERTICKESGLLATDGCPPSSVTTRVFIERPEPFVPYTDRRGRTFIPADAVLEAPVDLCSLHGGSSPVRPPAEGNDDDDTGHDGDQTDRVVVTIKARRYSYSPGQIRVPTGALISLRLTSEDVEHGIEIPALGVSMIVPAGETGTLELRVDTPGVYAFFCPVDCGPDRDRMVGQLIVTD